MLDATYIGDELTGTGFKLVGIHAYPAPDSVERLWQLVLEERERRQLIMLSADCAHQIRQRLVELLDSHPLPPVVILPGSESGDGPVEVIGEALGALGIEGISR